ncbi:hypothetical protein TSOC_010111 [Tetrabaena socialis]|uniref:Glutathione S-transferase C-terminal domain-containing protein n=1 Tax=Tetrabaena socialis TaxID=47790 RepID=A0A2J7ZU55_9CHLO|nr:hypothetical protein TSOC_010111 [Tetrabaena socialis]|eukprot:PNH03803.1 hypothetical protein TSOC_010111 [Tetrabaena socialis]
MAYKLHYFAGPGRAEVSRLILTIGGVPPNLLDDYPAVKAFRNKIANLPAVKAYFEKQPEEGRASFRPDA